MLIIGITGGIGSGKSLICKVLRTFGIPVFYTDDEVKRMYDEDADLQCRLSQQFGSDILQNNHLRSNVLARIVFNDINALDALCNLVYPALWQRFCRWTAAQNAPCIVMEAAMLCESNFYSQMSLVVNVSAPENIRISRVLRRNTGLTEHDIRQRILRQWTDEQRNEYSHITIINDNQTAILPQILALLTNIKSSIS
jgi:dephospho-CoA kinase